MWHTNVKLAMMGVIYTMEIRRNYRSGCFGGGRRENWLLNIYQRTTRYAYEPKVFGVLKKFKIEMGSRTKGLLIMKTNN